MIKELWILIKMLFETRPSDVAYKELEVVEMKHFPFEGYNALAWCGKIIHRMGSSEIDDITLTHEKIHAMQALFCDDSWAKYYWSYFVEWLKFKPWMNPASACYYINKYECEAYANEGNSEYPLRYDGLDLEYKYTIKSAKKMWKELGGTAKSWKAYVKSL
jgi:hypothetical protein